MGEERVRVNAFLLLLMHLLVLTAYPTYAIKFPCAGAQTTIDDVVFPKIQDFHINSTWTSQPCQFSFIVTDDVALENAVFGCNVTQTFTNETTLPLSGTQAWVNITKTLPSFSCVISFQLWVANTRGYSTDTRLGTMKVYAYDANRNFVYTSLASAIASVDSANNWTTADTYAQTVLAKKTTADLKMMIDNYANAGDWANVLRWSAICHKLGFDQQTAIQSALDGFTMVGSLPFTAVDTENGGVQAFSPIDKWALYGYYYAELYNVDKAKWNIAAAYSMFNSSVYRSFPGLPDWIHADGTAYGLTDRFYDEGACTIECYVIFWELLNVSGALNDALHWWDYVDSRHWNSAGYYQYRPYYFPSGRTYECEAAFFVKIVSQLRYHVPSLPSWDRVLTDVGTRFLSDGWNSPQWTDNTTGITTYATVHAYGDEPSRERRLTNTFGTWEILLGMFPQLNSTYQKNMKDMLGGSLNAMPAWALILTPYSVHTGGNGSGLYNNSTKMFKWASDRSDDNNATAYAEILLFLIGIIPDSSTIAFPLEDMDYEYVQDIDPLIMQFDLETRTIRIPVDNAGNMTFQYGVSATTCSFDRSGVWQVTFSKSWNIVTSLTCLSSLPPDLLYFSSIPEFPSAMILPLSILAILTAAIFLNKKRTRAYRSMPMEDSCPF